jgi:hypothetical protein
MNEENKKSGYILLHRSLRNHWIWNDAAKLQAWLDILLEVNHAAKKVNIGMHVINVERGQSVKSMVTWAKRWNWNKSKVNRFFKLLADEGMIVLTPNKQTTHLTVCNYGDYQDGRNANETPAKRKRITNESQTKTNKELKELKELKQTESFLAFLVNYSQKNEKHFLSNIFKDAWLDWCKHRQTIKKPLTARAAELTLGELHKHEEEIALLMIEKSIANRWTGVFPITNKTNMVSFQDIKKLEREKNMKKL